MSSTLAARDPKIDLLLSEVRRALQLDGSRDADRAVRVAGRGELFGSPVACELAFDGRGRFVRALRGRLGERAGFDGQRAWHGYDPGRTITLRFEDREIQLLSAWIATGFWLDPACPITIASAGDGALELRLEGGLRSARLVLDAATMRPARWEVDWVLGAQRFAFEGWIECDGILLPRRVVHAHGAVVASAFEIESWSSSPALSAAELAPPNDDSSDVRFRSGAPAELEARKTATGHPLVRARIAGRDAGWFIFDSGAAVSVIAPRTAEAIGLPAFGRAVSGGVGSTHSSDELREARAVEIGPLTLVRVVFLQRDLAPLEQALGVEIAGIVGFDVFSRAVVRVRMSDTWIELHDPRSIGPNSIGPSSNGPRGLEHGAWQELVIHGRHAHVHARYEGDREGLFRLDTGGGRANVLFHSPAVAQKQLLDGRVTSPAHIGGASGLSPVHVGELAWFEIGPRRFEKLRVIFAQPGSGALDDPYTDGTLGGGILGHLDVTFDYGRERIALRSAD